MDLTYSPDEQSFRHEVAGWLQHNLPSNWRYDGLSAQVQDFSPEIRRKWQRRLYDGGWLKLTWPAEIGGRGCPPVFRSIFDEELQRATAPPLLGHIGVALLVPLLMQFGTEWQKSEYIEDLLSGETIFCQGFSEPDAGSDLANLRATADYAGGQWRITGQKTWSSLAEHADRAFVLARTAPRDPSSPHSNIALFLIDLRQPGVQVVPIKQMTGSSEFSELFLSDAVVVDQDRIPGDGWKLAMATFGYERGYGAHPQRLTQAIDRLVRVAQADRQRIGERLRQEVASRYIETRVFNLNALRAVTNLQKGRSAGPEISISKLFRSELEKRITETALEILGLQGLISDGAYAIDRSAWLNAWMWSYAQTIYAGTNEIQRNIIAERVLGMPRGR